MATENIAQALVHILEFYPETDEPLDALQQVAVLTNQLAQTPNDALQMPELVKTLPSLVSALLTNRKFASAASVTLAGDILCNVTLLWPALHSDKSFLEALRLIADTDKPFYTLYNQEDATWAVPLNGQSEDLQEWRRTLSEGSELDAVKVDYQCGRRCWARATVDEIDDDDYLSLRFEAEGQEFDRIVPRDSCDIAPLRSKSEEDQWRETLKEGDLIDTYDLYNSWLDSVVLEVRTRPNDHDTVTTEVKVSIHEPAQQSVHHYNGLKDSSSEWLSVHSPRLAPLHSMRRKDKHYSGPIVVEIPVDDSNDHLEVGTHAYCVTRLTASRSRMLIRNLNRFGCAGMFEVALKRIEDLDEPLSFEAFHAIATFLSAPYKSYHRRFALQFVPKFKTAVFHYLSGCSDTVMRDFQREKIDSIKTGVDRMLGRIHPVLERGRILDEFFVELAVKFFRSPFLERRIHGLKSLSEFIRLCRYNTKKTLELDQLLQLVKQNVPLNQIFGTQGHPQLIKRSVDILRFLADKSELDAEDIDAIWAGTLTDDEETKQCLYKVLSEASSSMKPHQIELFVEKIAALPPTRLRKDELTLLYELTKYSLRAEVATSLASEFLFNVTINSEEHPTSVVEFALEKFTELMKTWHLRRTRLEVIVKCVEHIRQNHAAIQCLRIMKKLILGSPEQSSYPDTPSRAVLINTIVRDHAALPAIFDNLRHFKQLAENAQADTIVCDRMPYKAQIEERLGLLLVLLKDNYSLLLTGDQINTLWELLMQQAACDAEKVVFLKWLAELSEHQTQYSKVIEEQALQQFFKDKLAVASREFSDLGIEEFIVFKRFFLLVNVSLKRIKHVAQYSSSPIILSAAARRLGYQLIEPPTRLEGYNCLRKLLFEVHSTDLFAKAQELVFDLHENLIMTAYLPEVRQEFVQTCLAQLSEGSAQHKALILLKNFVSECNKGGTGGFKPHSSLLRGDVYLLSFNNQITYRFADPEIPKTFEIRVFSNTTLWELRLLLGKKVCCLPDQFRLSINLTELKDIDNGKTLRELQCRPTETFTLTRRYPSVHQASLLSISDEFTPPARKIFTRWFQEFADQGDRMSPEGCAAFTRSCTGDTCTATDWRVLEIFRRYDVDSDGLLALDDFLAFYKNACMYKLKTVWNDLTSHHYREDLKRFDDEDVEHVDTELLPTAMLTRDQSNFDLFFAALSRSELTEAAWELIVCLPTNPELLQSVEVDWKTVADSSSPHKLLYVLQIIEAFVEQARHDWVSKFLMDDGFQHLYELYMGLAYVEDRFQKGCVTSLLRLLSLFILASFSAVSPDIYEVVELVRKNSEGLEEDCEPSNDPKTEVPSQYRETDAYKALVQDLIAFDLADKIIAVVDFHQLVVRLIGVISQVLAKASYESEDKKIIDSALELFMSCLMHNNELLSTIYSLPDKAFVLQGLTFSHSLFVRRAFAQSFKGICEKTTHTEHMPTPYFLHFLIAALPTVQSGVDYTQFFELVCDLIELDSVNASLDYSEFLFSILNKLEVHPYTESSNSHKADNILVGLLNIAERIFRSIPHLKDECGQLVATLFSEYLFPPADAPSGETEPPKAKTQDSRAAAYQLLNTLVRGSAERLNELQLNLKELASRLEPVKSWSHLPSADTRRRYVGIVNLGCICYMNAMLQQFYMIPEFREGIMAVDDGKSPTNLAYLQGDPSIDRTETGVDVDDNVLHQLQYLFGFLSLSDRQAYNPSHFCYAFKDAAGRPVNVSIQEDSQEFLNKIFDKLEHALKETPYKELTQTVFGGKLCSQIICKECNTVKENMDYFYNLSVDVKNSKNLYESLEKFIAAEQISDYHCEHCEKPVEIAKRTLLDGLPDYLIVHLQRIVYSFDTLSNEKINTRLDFPHELCLYEYTKAGVVAKENEEELSTDLEAYKYDLIGIIVQTGTAEMGHYYSFIRDRKPDGSADPTHWFEFNDSLVKDFE